MTASSLGIAILALAGAWLFGSLLARLGGALLMLVGLVGVAATGDANGLVVFVLGAGMWLAGHWHYALRHRFYKSPVTERVFYRLPAWLDPTRDR
jgi:hypothetical protein